MTSLVGKILAGRYRVDTFLGRGGMAEVYKVWDNQRMVYLAMKVLHQDMAEDRIFLRRFQREAQTLANLDHSHIIRYHGLEQDGRIAFMLMEYIDGVSLRTEIFDGEGKPLSLGRVKKVMRSVCAALHYAHNKGMVHCDIKPANIMLDRYGEVRLADFGIARMTDGATATMVGAGTPAYMAPEQIMGKNPLPQTDVYGLGIVLYEMLTGGERPFTGEKTAATGSTGEKIRWGHLHAAPPSPRKWNPAISPELEAVIFKSLAKDPRKRYKNTLEFLNALELAIGDVSVENFVVRKSSDRQKKSKGRNSVRKSQNTPISTSKIIAIVGVVLSALLAFFFVLGQINEPEYPSTPSNPPAFASSTPINLTQRATIQVLSTASPQPTQTTQATLTAYPTQTPQSTNTAYPTYTPYPEPTEIPNYTATPLGNCEGVDWMPQPKIKPGVTVEVCTKLDRLIVHKNIENSSEIIRVYPGYEMFIVSGPYCEDESWWWEVIVPEGARYAVGSGSYSSFKSLSDSVQGYVREGRDQIDKYYICP